MPQSKIVRDYYRVSIPGDCADTIDELGHIAINEARERAKLYCMPADWRATLVRGQLGDFEVTFRVVRYRNRVTRPRAS